MSFTAGMKKIYRWVAKQKRTVKAMREAKEVAMAPSYYPEKECKSFHVKKKENILWAKKYGEPNRFYTLYGLDVVGSNADQFIDYYSFMCTRNIANRVNKLDSQTILLRDKFLFYKYMQSNGFPVPQIFAVARNGKLYDSNFKQIEWDSIKTQRDYFIKDIDGECASFVKHIDDYNDLTQIMARISKGGYIFQRKLIQCDEMNVINPNAINTLRIVTINKDGDPYVLTALLRVGTSKSGKVDNWAAGGLAIGIESDGMLKKWGFYKPVHGLKTDMHPDTRIVFSDFEVPMYKEALELACSAHKSFYGIRAIGWDVAISKDGPMFIEGNDNWEISLQQACDRPLKKDWFDAIK